MRKKKALFTSLILLSELVFFAGSIIIFSEKTARAPLPTWGTVECSCSILCIALMAILSAGFLFDHTNLTKGMILFLCMVTVTGTALFFTVVYWCVENDPDRIFLNKASNYIQFLTSPVQVLLYWLYLISSLDLDSREVNVFSELIKILCILDVIFILFNIPLGHLFTIDANAVYHQGKLFSLTLLYPIIGLLSIVFILILQRMPARQCIAFLLCIFMPVAGNVILGGTDGVSLTYSIDALSIILLYLSLFLDRSRDLLISQAELSRQKMSVMASQIQPHFLYNALTAIMSIRGNPPETKEALSDFSSYLRGNLNVLKQTRPIPFSEELTHIHHYLHLEKLRFEEDLTIEYDIRTESFLVPALSVQMLAENAVKHGITAKEDGGKLFIGTEDAGDEFLVTVRDDGVGFSEEALNGTKDDDGRIHVGLENIENRLWDMVGGSMEIRSERGVGTEILLHLPKSGQPER